MTTASVLEGIEQRIPMPAFRNSTAAVFALDFGEQFADLRGIAGVGWGVPVSKAIALRHYLAAGNKGLKYARRAAERLRGTVLDTQGAENIRI